MSTVSVGDCGCNGSVPITLGDSVSIAFLVRDEAGAIVDVTGIVFTGRIVDYRGVELLTLLEGTRIVISNPLPPTAPVNAEQEPHGWVNLDEDDTGELHEGALQSMTLRLAFDGQTDTTEPVLLEGLSA